MALWIQKRKWKNRDGSVTESWRLVIDDYTSGKKLSTYPEKRFYPKYGLDSDESFERAREKIKALQAKAKIERSDVLRSRIEKRLKKEDLKESAFLPSDLYRRFLSWLQDRRVWDEIPSKTVSHLRCMRRMILEINLDPSEWPDKPERIYRWFLTHKYSLSYIDKVLPYLNDYGYFYCKEFKRPFLSLKTPPLDIARRIDESNRLVRDGSQAESLPIYPGDLKRLRDLSEEQFRWMRLSVYFGLRPNEIDDLILRNRNKSWNITKDAKGTLVLAIYQRKLVRVSHARRWKRIPCILPDQRALLEEIESGMECKRPLVKTIKRYLGEGYLLYGGRKGFEKYMRTDHKQRFENISRWLGHQDIKRTEQNYREIEAVEYDIVETARSRKPRT